MKKYAQVVFVIFMMFAAAMFINVNINQKALAASVQDMMLVTRIMPWSIVNNGAGNGWMESTTSAADSALGVAERNIASTNAALSNICTYAVPYGCNALMVRFYSTTADATFDVDVWLNSSDGYNLIKAGTLDVVTGTQDVYGTAYHFADTCNVSTESLWSLDSYVSAAEHCVILEISDLKGFDKVVFHGYGTFAEDLYIEVKGY